MTGAQIAAAARRQQTVIPRRTAKETVFDRAFRGLMYGALGIAFVGLAAIIYDFAKDGLPIVSWDFITSFPSRVIPERAGIQSAVVGTIYLMILCAFFVVPLGVMTAVYLEEYADQDRWYNRLIEVNIQNLAAVPSVVYGILGLAFIVRGPLGARAGAAGRRDHAEPAGAAGRDHRGARGDPGRAAVDPRGFAGARRDASGRRSGSRCCQARSPASRRVSSLRCRGRSARLRRCW